MHNSQCTHGRPAGRWWPAALCVVSAVAAGVSADVVVDRPQGENTATNQSSAVQARFDFPAMTEDALLDYFEGGLAGGTIADIGVICSQATASPTFCQLPDQASARTADKQANFKVAERFANQTGGPVTITSICWWGIYLDFASNEDCSTDPALVNHLFDVKFYNDEQGIAGCPKSLPGTRKAQFLDIVYAKAETGNMMGTRLEFEYTATLPSGVTVADGECVWIEVLADTPGTASDNCVWLWMTSPTGDAFAVQDIDSDGQYDRNEFIDDDLAFCVDFVLGDSSPCDVPPDPACDGGTGNCGGPTGLPSCEDACCASIVGEIDPTCCTVEWTQFCADLAISEGCAVRPECQPDDQCQRHEVNLAYNAVTDATHPADDFTLDAGGAVTDICWYGIYAGNNAAAVDAFTITYYDNDGGIPGAVVASYNVGNSPSRTETGEDFQTADWTSLVYEFAVTHAATPVLDAGACYWVSIHNAAADVDWLWLASEDGDSAGEKDDPPREGNARLLVDDTPADDWTNAGIGAGNDFSFCIGHVMTVPACGFETPYDTGYHEVVQFDANDTGQFASTNLGWSSGDLTAGPGTDDQRRCAQPLLAPPVTGGLPSWSIEQLAIEGFDPGGVTTEFMNMEIFTRTALDVQPTPDDLIWAAYEVPFDPAVNVDATTTEVILLIPVGSLNLPAGDYWLTFWASNSSAGTQPANFAWFTNAKDLGDLVNVACTDNMPPPNVHPGGWIGCLPDVPGFPNGYPAMLRTHLYPDPGFGAYTLDDTLTLTVDPVEDPDPDPADLYNAAFRYRGTASTCGDGVTDPGEECDDGNNISDDGCSMGCISESDCPCDCEDPPDGTVDVGDFLALLAQWGNAGTCDCEDPPDGAVDVGDFLAILAAWGPCP